MALLPTTPEATRLQQHAERSVPEEAPEILALGLVAHVGFVLEGKPHVIPFTYQYDPKCPDRLYLHGSLTGTTLTHLASGAPVCVEVSLLDGLVYSKTALYHSMNYRSVIAFGRARAIEGEAEKRSIFEPMIARYFAGRTEGRDYSSPTTDHLNATALLEMTIEEWGAKARRGGPNGPADNDPDAPGSSGVVDLRPESR
jgi:nitroimidazol reductase NimA-like FMN-containing flavoprotein (pyridoxamine 5'-phosphate oxidase superfamily)